MLFLASSENPAILVLQFWDFIYKFEIFFYISTNQNATLAVKTYSYLGDRSFNHLAEIRFYKVEKLIYRRVKMQLLSGMTSNKPLVFGHLAPLNSVQKVEGFFRLFTPSG